MRLKNLQRTLVLSVQPIAYLRALTLAALRWRLTTIWLPRRCSIAGACVHVCCQQIPTLPEEGEEQGEKDDEEKEEGEIHDEWGHSKPDLLKERLGLLLECLTQYDLAKRFIDPTENKINPQSEEVSVRGRREGRVLGGKVGA